MDYFCFADWNSASFFWFGLYFPMGTMRCWSSVSVQLLGIQFCKCRNWFGDLDRWYERPCPKIVAAPYYQCSRKKELEKHMPRQNVCLLKLRILLVPQEMCVVISALLVFKCKKPPAGWLDCFKQGWFCSIAHQWWFPLVADFYIPERCVSPVKGCLAWRKCNKLSQIFSAQALWECRYFRCLILETWKDIDMLNFFFANG